MLHNYPKMALNSWFLLFYCYLLLNLCQNVHEIAMLMGCMQLSTLTHATLGVIQNTSAESDKATYTFSTLTYYAKYRDNH